jgi:hypothetical protein
MKIAPGTIAAIAASLMAQGENLGENAEIFSPHWAGARNNRIKQFVRLAAEIAHETEIFHDCLKGNHHA